jgi:hypothetical protein
MNQNLIMEEENRAIMREKVALEHKDNIVGST